MKIYIRDLKKFAAEFLRILEDQKIESTKDLEGLIGQQFRIENQIQDFISFENRPSNLNTMAYTISYTKPGTGIPIELKINSSLNYSQIIIKAQEVIYSYLPFMIDTFENFIQNKVLDSSDILILKKEVVRLTQLK